MKIQILGHRKAGELARSQPGLLDFVFITNPVDPFELVGSRSIIENCREHIRRDFEDIELPREKGVHPSFKDIEAILNWVKDRQKWAEEEDILTVSCSAGISRSAATAYVINCMVHEPEAAMSVLDEKIHWPNIEVVEHGAAIMGRPEMKTLIEAWKARVALQEPTGW